MPFECNLCRYNSGAYYGVQSVDDVFTCPSDYPVGPPYKLTHSESSLTHSLKPPGSNP